MDNKFLTFSDNEFFYTEFDPDPLWFDDEELNFVPDPTIKDISPSDEIFKTISIDDSEYIYGKLDFSKLVEENDITCHHNFIKGNIVYYKKPYILRMEVQVNQMDGGIENIHKDGKVFVTKNVISFVQLLMTL